MAGTSEKTTGAVAKVFEWSVMANDEYFCPKFKISGHF